MRETRCDRPGPDIDPDLAALLEGLDAPAAAPGDIDGWPSELARQPRVP